MNKKVVIGIIVAVIVVVIAIFGYTMYKNAGTKDDKVLNNDNTGAGTAVVGTEDNLEPEKPRPAETDDEDDENDEVSAGTVGSKTLVVYFSAQSHTKAVAEKVAKNLDADVFEIVPADKYTAEDLSYNDNNSRASKEHEDESLQDIKLVEDKVKNWEEYDTILIGYPIWWGVSAWPTDSFVKANDFNGKTVIPFCTSHSSGLGQSGKLLEEKANGGTWLEGKRFSQDATDSEIKEWTDSLK